MLPQEHQTQAARTDDTAPFIYRGRPFRKHVEIIFPTLCYIAKMDADFTMSVNGQRHSRQATYKWAAPAPVARAAMFLPKAKASSPGGA